MVHIATDPGTRYGGVGSKLLGEGSASGGKQPETETAGKDRQETASARAESRGDRRRIRAGGHGRSVEGV